MFQVHLLEEFLLEALGKRLDVHVVAVASALAAAVDVLLALGVEEVGDRGEDSTDLLALEEAAIDVVEGVLGVLLVAVLDVDVAHDVVAQVVHHDHVLDLAVLAHLAEDLLEELFKPRWGGNYLESAFSASYSVTMLPEMMAVSTALFSYMC